MREILVGSKVYPLEALFIVGRVWRRFDVPYAVPKFMVVVKDKKTKELRTSLTEEEIKKVQEMISKTFFWDAIIVKFEDLEKQINEKYKEELLKAREEGKITFSFTDALYNEIAKLLKNKDPVEFEI